MNNNYTNVSPIIIKNNKYIPLDPSYEFVFSEEYEKNKHPVSNYFLKINDLSINLMINLKWIFWGYFFMSSISENLNNENLEWKNLIDNNIQKDIINNITKEKHEILIDNNIINTKKDLDNLINILYNKEYFNENTKIHIKLKLNIDEFLIISNYLFPTLTKFK